MAVISIPKSTSAKMVLAAGTDPQTGRAKTKTVIFSKLASNPDSSKIMAVVDAASPVLTYPVTRVETTEIKTLEKTA